MRAFCIIQSSLFVSSLFNPRPRHSRPNLGQSPPQCRAALLSDHHQNERPYFVIVTPIAQIPIDNAQIKTQPAQVVGVEMLMYQAV